MQKTNQKGFTVEKVIKRKGDKLYIKWKCYDNSFSSWINTLDTFPDLSKLSDVVKNKVVKKYVYDELAKKVNVIGINGLVKKQIVMLRSMRLKVKYLILLA